MYSQNRIGLYQTAKATNGDRSGTCVGICVQTIPHGIPRQKEFADTIIRAKSRIEEYAEARLFDRDGVNGAKFSLINNFRGWGEKPEQEQDTGSNMVALAEILMRPGKIGTSTTLKGMTRHEHSGSIFTESERLF